MVILSILEQPIGMIFTFPSSLLQSLNLNSLLHLHQVQWMGSDYSAWLCVFRKSGLCDAFLSLQVPWSSDHTEWSTVGLDCHWLARSTSAGRGVAGCCSRPLCREPENKPTIHCWKRKKTI